MRLMMLDWRRSFSAVSLITALCLAMPALAQKNQPAAASTSTNTSAKSSKGSDSKSGDKAGDNGNGVLPGSSSKDPVNIDATKLDYFDKEQKLIYTGNVVAVQGESRLLTSVLVIFMMPKDTSNGSGTPSSTNNQVRRMEAPNFVTLTQKDQVATGDSGIYVKADNKVYLNGNVTLTQGPNVTKGDKLIYDLNTSQALVTGHIKSLFVPNNDDNKDASKDTPKEKESGPKKTGKSAESSQNDTTFKAH